MVLGLHGPGRVGRRRFFTHEPPNGRLVVLTPPAGIPPAAPSPQLLGLRSRRCGLDTLEGKAPSSWWRWRTARGRGTAGATRAPSTSIGGVRAPSRSTLTALFAVNVDPAASSMPAIDVHGRPAPLPSAVDLRIAQRPGRAGRGPDRP